MIAAKQTQKTATKKTVQPVRRSAPQLKASPKGSNQTQANVQPFTITMVNPNATQLTKPDEGASFRMHGKDLLIRLDGLQRLFAINLLPGQTGLAKLDAMASHYSWAKHNSAPTLAYKPLSDITTNGIWFYRVVHDVTPAQLGDMAMWNIGSRAFTAQKASLPFSITVPLVACGGR